MTRLTFFSFFDPDNQIDEYVIYYLKELNKVSDVIFSADCHLSENELSKLKDLTLFNIHYKHGEYDFGSYKNAYIKATEKNLLKNYDWLILANDSCYGPFTNLTTIFHKMERQFIDFWGFTHNTIDATPHVQSYFISLNTKTFTSKTFTDFILSIKKEGERKNIISKYEHGLTHKLSAAGFKFNTFLEELPNKFLNDPANNWDTMIIKGFPFIKRTLFTRNPYKLKNIFNYKKIVQAKFPSYNTNLIDLNLNRYKYPNETVIYTAIFNQDEKIIEQPNIKNTHFICFTNQNIQSKSWSIINIDPPIENNANLSCAYIQTHPHELLKRHTTSLFIKSNTLIGYDFTTMTIKKFEDVHTSIFYLKNTINTPTEVVITKHNKLEVINFHELLWERILTKKSNNKLLLSTSLKEQKFIKVSYLDDSNNRKKWTHSIDKSADFEKQLKNIKRKEYFKKLISFDKYTIVETIIKPLFFYIKLPYIIVKIPIWHKKISRYKISKKYFLILLKLIIKNKMQRKEIRDYIRRN